MEAGAFYTAVINNTWLLHVRAKAYSEEQSSVYTPSGKLKWEWGFAIHYSRCYDLAGSKHLFRNPTYLV